MLDAPQLVAALALLLPALPSRALPAGGPDFESVGQAFLTQHGLDPLAAPKEILTAGTARFTLGAFDLRFPREALEEPDALGRFQAAAHAVLEAHLTWLAWVDPVGERLAHKEVKADVQILERWIGSWKAKDLEALGPAAELGTLPGKDKEQAALLRFNAALAGAGFPAGASEERAVFVLVPDRRSFVERSAALGVAVADQRGVFWSAGVTSWVEFRFDELRVAALEYAGLDPAAWQTGLPMNGRNERGLEEQIAQLAFGSLVLQRFGNRIDPDFSHALCNNLVIDQFGEVDTRSDGDLRPRTAPPRKVFVPGGLSQGGVLPPNNADSPWRASKGADRFLGALRAAQVQGASELGERHATHAFALASDDTTETFAAQGPFFGEAAGATVVPPANFQGNWLELQRAYRVAFCHWLREAGAGSKADSKEAFANLLARLAAGGPEQDFAAELEAAFGAPLSSASPDSEDLEGRFLTWLSKRKGA